MRLHQRQWSDNIQPHNKTESKTTIKREKRVQQTVRERQAASWRGHWIWRMLGKDWQSQMAQQRHTNTHARARGLQKRGWRLERDWLSQIPVQEWGIKRHTADKGSETLDKSSQSERPSAWSYCHLLGTHGTAEHNAQTLLKRIIHPKCTSLSAFTHLQDFLDVQAALFYMVDIKLRLLWLYYAKYNF